MLVHETISESGILGPLTPNELPERLLSEDLPPAPEVVRLKFHKLRSSSRLKPS